MRAVTLGLGIAALVCAVLSARLGVPSVAYGVVACAIATMILSVWGRLESRAIPYLVFLLGLAFLYQSTLISNGLIGTDIHTEYYFYREALNGWDISYPHSYNTAIGTTLIAPLLTNWLNIPGYWIYKAIFPFVFALVPMILFVVYRKEFGETVAFLGSVFFITLPTYTLEMIGLPRQMLGELMLAVILLLVVVRPIRLNYSIPLLCVASSLGYMFHYITGPAILLYLAGGSILLVLMKHRQFAVRYLLVVLAVYALVGAVDYSSVADGVVMENLGRTGGAVVERAVGDGDVPVSPVVIPDEDGATPSVPSEGWWVTEYFSRQEPLIRTALGLDFMEASVSGKVFRVLQFGTQIALLLGCVWLLRNWRKVSAEYMAFTLTAIALIAACILLPRFSNIINVTRFYHLALFLVSPLLIVGGLYVFRRMKVVLFVLLIPYMLFTTGVVFEASKETDISAVTMPYSIALSNDRVGMIGTYTDNDVLVRDWALEQEYTILLTDINGMLILSEVAEPSTYLYTPAHNFEAYPLEARAMMWGYIPRELGNLPDGGYTYLVYLTEWNTQNGLLMFKPMWYAPEDTTSGMRQGYSFEFVGLSGDFVEVYRQGDAVVLGWET